jgi:predicted O-linked N-acetylglucosamine transferase (SPINDLY family)
LICASTEEYVQTAIRLANDAKALQRLKERVRLARSESALFDISRFTANFETAMTEIWMRWQQGLSPVGLTIPESEDRG